MQGTRELGTRRELDGCCGECGGDVAEYNRQRRFITLLIQEKDGKQSEEGQGCVCCWFGYIEMGEYGFAGGLKKEGTRVTIERRERN